MNLRHERALPLFCPPIDFRACRRRGMMVVRVRVEKLGREWTSSEGDSAAAPESQRKPVPTVRSRKRPQSDSLLDPVHFHQVESRLAD